MVDPNVWIRTARRPDGYEYYEILLVYVDDITIVSNLGLTNFIRSRKGIKVHLCGT